MHLSPAPSVVGPWPRAEFPPGQAPGDVLALISSGVAVTRAEIARRTGLARSTVSLRVDALIAHGFVDEGAEAPSTGGRPPRRLSLRTRGYAVAGIDIGASHCRVALLDVGGALLVAREDPLTIADGPEAVLGHVERTLRTLLETAGGAASRTLRAIGVGVPGPVEFSTGRPVDPPIMPGWHHYAIPEFFEERFGVRALVDNDVNVMALAEQRRAWPDALHLLYLKVGTGIGCGIVADGRVHRGARGRPETSGTSVSESGTTRAAAATPAAWKPSPGVPHWPSGCGSRGWRPPGASTSCDWSGKGTARPSGWSARPVARSARCCPVW